MAKKHEVSRRITPKTGDLWLLVGPTRTMERRVTRVVRDSVEYTNSDGTRGVCSMGTFRRWGVEAVLLEARTWHRREQDGTDMPATAE
jgi:hypothetical protein